MEFGGRPIRSDLTWGRWSGDGGLNAEPEPAKEPGRAPCLPVRNDESGAHGGRDSDGTLQRVPHQRRAQARPYHR